MKQNTGSDNSRPNSGGGADSASGGSVRVMVYVNKGVTSLAIDELELTRQEDMDDFARQVSETIETLSRPNIVINFGSVRLICSRLLGHIIAINKRIMARGGKLKLAAVNPEIRKVFAITALDRQIKIYDSVEAATRSFRLSRLFELLGGPQPKDG